MASRTLYMLSLDLCEPEKLAFDTAVREFPKELGKAVRSAEVEVQAAPNWIEDFLISSKLETLDVINCDLLGKFAEQSMVTDSLIVACTRDHFLARAATEAYPNALWGAANVGGPLGLIYGNFNKYVIWHEILHLFGLTDCYQLPDPKPKCNEPRCLMQYEPSEATTGPGIALCEQNMEKLRTSFR